MFPQRPHITVRLPARIYPGDRFEALFELTSKKQQQLEHLDVFFFGFEAIWNRKSNYRSKNPIVHQPYRLGSKLKLEKGKNEFRCDFDVPTDLPPSYQNQWYQVQYEIEVHAALSWWPDAKDSFIAKIKTPPQSLTGKAQLAATARSIQGKDPYLEASLSSNVLSIGGYCVGAVSLGNVALNRYQKVSVGLVGLQSTSPFQPEDVEEVQHRYTELPIHTPEEGRALPFRFQIPQDLSASFVGRWGKLQWCFEVRASIGWKSDCVLRIPILLLPQAPNHEASPPPRAAPPTVGSARVQHLWSQVAQRFSLQFKDEEISGLQAGCGVSITREPRPHGFCLVGRLAFPSLHLQLQIQPSSGLGRLFTQSISFQIPRWDQRYRVQAREEEQARTLVGPLIVQLNEFDSLHATDSYLVVERRDSGQNEEQLKQFTQQLLHTAKNLKEARSNIPPPAQLREGIDHWLHLAQQLSAELETARMAIHGSLDGIPCEVITHWPQEPKPLYTELLVRTQIPQHFRQVLELPTASAASLPTDAPEVIEQLSKDAQYLTLDAESMSLTFAGALLNPLFLRAQIEILLQLSMLLNSGSGPYR